MHVSERVFIERQILMNGLMYMALESEVTLNMIRSKLLNHTMCYCAHCSCYFSCCASAHWMMEGWCPCEGRFIHMSDGLAIANMFYGIFFLFL